MEVQQHTTERQRLWNVYSTVLKNWAVGNDFIVKTTKLDVKEVKRLARKLERTGLLAGEHVNQEREITWQTMYDVENDRDAVKKGTADFNTMYPKNKPVAAAKKTGRQGATGPRYTDAQLKEAKKLRKAGKPWKQIAEAINVKSPAYLAKVVKEVR